MMSSSTTAPLPSYPGTILPIHGHPAWKHLSGTTMDKANLKEPVVQPKPAVQAKANEVAAALKDNAVKKLVARTVVVKDVATKEDVVYLPISNTTLNRFADITTTTKRASYATTTKAELRQSNQQMFEMLQTLQTELATHRTLMLDIQSRLSFLEQDAPTMVDLSASEALSSPLDEPKAPSRPPPPPPRRPSSLIEPGLERQSWWQACQNFAENCDTPFNVKEFITTPSRFEDFDFHFGGLPTDGVRPQTPVEIDIENVPALSPESAANDSDVSDIEVEEPFSLSPEAGRPSSEDAESLSPSIFSEGAPRTSGLTMTDCEDIDNIIEQIVEFRKPAALPPLLLHPPPSGRDASIFSVEEITALPDLPPAAEINDDPQRHRKGIRAISSKWASLKGRSAETSYYRNGIFSMR
ncbi:hypothetical protein C7974DRAFT_388031 [Boeremia exigua]|uniref:uncharacterized protein n=1 Tax=Boeremia exigua TaxID=749465 RepID=UPI001E8E41B3|nr:uncharacterized protein C7974DRAFT_388031 [Boeremia exigua]KAH6639208.1 hypothetical protein C7974DRAFT_388031 [Boeremia exigua]